VRKDDAGHVGKILDGLLRKWEKGTVKKGDAVRAAWVAATREEARKHARPISLKRGILMVLVENSPWLYELTIEKKDMLKKFNEHYTGRKKAKDIRFRVGTLDG
jgi:predicted nucleic acid-binding Zn ribbon protein